MQFRDFLLLAEAKFSPKTIKQLELDKGNTFSREHRGWQVWFCDRTAAGTPRGDVYKFFQWLDNLEYEEHGDQALRDEAEDIEKYLHSEKMGTEVAADLYGLWDGQGDGNYPSDLMLPHERNDSKTAKFKSSDLIQGFRKAVHQLDLSKEKMQQTAEEIAASLASIYDPDQTDLDDYWADTIKDHVSLVHFLRNYENGADPAEAKKHEKFFFKWLNEEIGNRLSEFIRDVEPPWSASYREKQDFREALHKYIFDNANHRLKVREWWDISSRVSPKIRDMAGLADLYRRGGMEALARFVTAVVYDEIRGFLQAARRHTPARDHTKLVRDYEWLMYFVQDAFLKGATARFNRETGTGINDQALHAAAVEVAKQNGLFKFENKTDIWGVIENIGHHAGGDPVHALARVMHEGLRDKMKVLGRSFPNHIYGDDREKYHKEWAERGWRATVRVLDTLHSFGIRKFNRVPIVLYYQERGEPSSWGDGTTVAAGQAFKDYAAVYGDQTEAGFIRIIAHELGHIVYDRLPYEEQQRVRELALTRKPFNTYGSPDYLYSGMTTPGIHHQMGNEWFATMIEFWAMNADRLAAGAFKTPEDLKANAQSMDIHPTDAKGMAGFNQTGQLARGAWASQRPGGDMKGGYKQYPSSRLRPPRRLVPRYTPKADMGAGIAGRKANPGDVPPPA